MSDDDLAIRLAKLEEQVKALEAENAALKEQAAQEAKDAKKFWQGWQPKAHATGTATLDISVGAKQSLVAGYSGSLVAGEATYVNLGLKQSLDLLNTLSFMLGWSVSGYLGNQTSIGTARTKAHLQQTRLAAIESDIRANHNALDTAFNALRGAAVAVQALSNRITATEEDIEGNANRIQALETRCSAQNIQMAANAVNTLFQRTDALAQAIITVAQHTCMTGQRTDMSGNATDIGGTSTELAALRTLI